LKQLLFELTQAHLQELEKKGLLPKGRRINQKDAEVSRHVNWKTTS
jgi:hypothetical protein